MRHRFSIKSKIILLGAGITLILLTIAFLVSFFVYKKSAQKSLIKLVDSSLMELNVTLKDEEIMTNLIELKDELLSIYNENKANYNKSFDNPDDELEYYRNMYTNFYDMPGMIGMSQTKLRLRNTYQIVSSELSSAVISSNGVSAYIALIDTEYNRLIYLVDSMYDLGVYNGNGHLFGSYYNLNQNDIIKTYKNEDFKTYHLNGCKTRFFSIYDSGNKEVAKVFIEYNENSVETSVRSFVLIESLVFIASFIVLLLVYILFAHFLVFKNVQKLTKSTNEFTQDIKNSNELKVIDPYVKSNDEIGQLSSSFVTLENAIVEYLSRIEEDAKEKEKMNAELEIASKIQLEALPNKEINDDNVLIASSIKPAKEVGGDFYDYFYIDKDHLAIVISDVSGKGIPASLFMMKSKELIKSTLLRKLKLNVACEAINNELIKNNDAGLFITSFVGILNVKTKELEFVNAGHEKPYLISKDGVKKLDTKSNFVFGGLENFKYESEKIKLNENDKLFLYTDGLNEAINKNKEEFSYVRISQILEKYGNTQLENIIKEMSHGLKEFVGDEPTFDDVTMLLFELKSENLKFEFDNPSLSIIDEVIDKFNDYYSFVEKSVLSKLGIAFDEILNNCISYEKNDKFKLLINIEYKNNEFIIEIKSNGKEFNPLELKDNYIKEFSEDLKEGGMGITIAKNMVDKLDYERIDGFNVLKLKKSTK